MLTPVFILEIKDADDRAFMASLYQQHYPLMRHVAWGVLRDETLAGDMVNEAFLSLLCKISVLRALDGCTLRAYLVSTVRNVSINALTRRNRRNAYAFLDDGSALDQAVSDEESPLDAVLRSAEIERLTDGLKRLPPRDRWLLEMKYFRKMNDAEIARQLKIGENSVRMYLTKARRKLGDLIGKDDSFD